MTVQNLLSAAFCIALGAANAVCLTQLWRRCVPLQSGYLRRAALFAVLLAASVVVIWVGDHNLFFMAPPFFAAGLWCFGGRPLGRLTMTAIFFSLILSVDALLDTYLPLGRLQGTLPGYLLRTVCRTAAFVGLWLLLRRRLPETPPDLRTQLWRLLLGLAAMPLCALTAVVLLTWGRYDSPVAARQALLLGAAVLPFVLLTSLVLLFAVRILADYQRLERAAQLADLRELYYRGLRRQETQLRTLRHDLRNHLTVVRGLLTRGEDRAALDYLDQLAGSPALQGGRRFCANETANAVLSSKAEELRRAGLEADFAASLPEKLPVSDTDLCALLGNALDNALEGARQADDRRVVLRCRAERGLLMLRVENAVGGPVRPDLSTTKAGDGHGFGLPGMREIAERYGGTLEAAVRGGRFQLLACLPLDG